MKDETLNKTEKQAFKDLIKWFKRNQRNLPWRGTPSPYHVWISEIMLQQTVVGSVIDHYKRWMTRFADVRTLSTATQGQVLRLWEGLGYYNRARNILKSAKIISDRHSGEIPSDYDDLIALPGIGEYTASAIMSIAFNQPCPVLDANVRRVGRRILSMLKWDKEGSGKLQNYLKEAMKGNPPGLFNEALMELGQTVCIPNNPLCKECPLSEICTAFQKNIQNQIPVKKKQKIISKKTYLLICLHNDGCLIEMKKKGVLEGLWRFPSARNEDMVEKIIRGEIAIDFEFLEELPERTHCYTRYRERLIPKVYRIKSKPHKTPDNQKWTKLENLSDLPFPSVYRKIIEDLCQSS